MVMSRRAVLKSPGFRPFSSSSSWHSNFASRSPVAGSDCDEESLYSYTAGRWLWNEPEQLARRYRPFDLAELSRIASTCVGASTCTEIKKLPEGNFNKTFLMTADNGRQAIARIPNPNAGRPHFSTASEVATMDFVPLLPFSDASSTEYPQNTRFQSTRVEFTRLCQSCWGRVHHHGERVPGTELSHVWDGLTGTQKYDIVKQLVDFESRFASTGFSKIGSLYYATDLLQLTPQPQQLYTDQNGQSQDSSIFVIGPTNSRSFFDDGRSEVDVDRGPWNSAVEYATATAYREIERMHELKGAPKLQGVFGGPGQYQPSAARKLSTLHNYLKVAKYLLPKDKNLHRPILWHSDLHSDNIFVDPSRPTHILGIIDWQSVQISPLFLQARHPSLLELDGSIPDSFTINLPENFEHLTPEMQVKAKQLKAAQSLYKLYEIASFKATRDVYQGIRTRETLGCQITGMAGSIFDDGEPLVQSMLVEVQTRWSEIAAGTEYEGVECPLNFSEEQREDIAGSEALWREGVELMDLLRREVGAFAGWDGWVGHEEWEITRERVIACRERFVCGRARTEAERARWEEVFPFPVG